MNIFEIEVKLRSGIDCMVYHKPIKFQYNGCSCKVYRYLEDALEEIQQYRAIGTPEKCRAAVEKQKAKKPQKTESEGYRYTDTYRCPNCGGNFSGTGIANYCYHCGQKLDWGDVE